MEWRDVPGFEGTYQVSDTGAVRRIDAGRGARPGRLLIPGKHAQGYLAVGLWRNNRPKGFLVHRLVAAAFLGEPAGREVNHRDGDKTNNALANLEYVTRQENIDHAVRTGLIASAGELNSQAKLTAAQVVEIRQLKAQGLGYKRIARRFGVTWEAVRNIIKGRTWTSSATA